MSRVLVRASIEDATGDRCVDLLEQGGAFGWVECRKDPEDPHGWRHLHPPRWGLESAAAARADAHTSVGWLRDNMSPA